MARVCSRQRAGFTLIELLVVVAIIATLIGLLLPAVQKVRESAARMSCQNNLKQMGLALHQYQLDNHHFPSGYYPQSSILWCSGWQFQLLPYLEQSTRYGQGYVFDVANGGNAYGLDSNSNPMANFQMPTFVCPSNTRPETLHYVGNGLDFDVSLTSYMGCAGTNSWVPLSGDGLLFVQSQVRIEAIMDGTSSTIAIGERPCSGDLYYGWGFAPAGPPTASGYTGAGDTVIGSSDAALAQTSGDLATNVGLRPPSDPYGTSEIDVAHFWSFHDGGANFLFCDGSVHFLSYSANSVFPALCTVAGGEAVALPF